MISVNLAPEHGYRDGGPLMNLINMYAETMPPGGRWRYELRGRPGLYRPSAATGYDAAVGSGPVNIIETTGAGSTWVMSGTGVYYNGGSIGTVASGGFQDSDYTETQMVMLSGYNAYLVGPASVAQITDADLPEVSSVAFIAGLWVYTVRDSGEFVWSEPNDATDIDPLSFSNAESHPDPIVRAITLGTDLIFLGSETLEPQVPTGDPDTPFSRVGGRGHNIGCAAYYSVVRADNALFFAGQEQGFGHGIYRYDGGTPTRISTRTIDAVLSASAAAVDLVNARAYYVVQEGHSFYVLRIPNQGCYAYDIAERKWSKWESYGLSNFRIVSGNGTFFGDSSGNIYQFDPDLYADDGDVLSRTCSALIPADQTVRIDKLRLDVSTGVSLATGQGSNAVVEKRYTDDLIGNYSSWDSVSLGLQGVYTARAEWWQDGLMNEPGRLYEFRVTDPVKFIARAVSVNPAR